MIKAICFDLDGVYFTSASFQRFKANLPKTVTDEEKINHVLAKSDEILNFKRGKLTEEEYWNFARKELGITVDNEGIFTCLRDSYEINPDVRKYIAGIRAKGYKSCACSNNFVTRIRELNNKFDFLKDFDFTVFSYDVGITKPDKEIFEKLVEKSGVQPNEIVYSDDDESKLAGAKELGIQAFVFENFEQFTKKLEELGVEV